MNAKGGLLEMITEMPFHTRLKALREARGLTQDGLARAAGLTVSTVTKLERPGKEPSWDTAKKLAKALGVTLDELADEEDSPPEAKRRRGHKAD
jgi:transcriptional regulator with XRE-family HTH domain